MTSSPKLQTALQMAHKGRRIFPADSNKKPIIKDWSNKATIDATILQTWFGHQNYNLAVVTGHKSGFFCLDVDGEAGKESLLQLEKQYGAIPVGTACMAITPSNGVHYYS